MDTLPERTAAGFVLFREGRAGREYLLLTIAERSEPGFPKGHADPGESEAETARRETEEETGLTDLEVWGAFRHAIEYVAARKGKRYRKTVVYFLARARSGEVTLSPEHSAHVWTPLAAGLDALPHEVLKTVLRDAALFGKDPALFDLEPASEHDARAHLLAQPHVTEGLVRHLSGGAVLARALAAGLHAAGAPVHVEAAATGTMLHDVGRALGMHDDHPRQGLIHLRTTPLSAYGFACVSHFTKGASPDALRAAGVADEQVEDFERLIDLHHLTWEEKCAALADACMRGDTPVPPAQRFADLRQRYDAEAIIALQERRTEDIRRAFRDVLGRDPLALLGLA